MEVRRRHDGDMPALLDLLRLVHRTAGYPRHWPDDAERFLAPPGLELEAWVAVEEPPMPGDEDGGAPVGHVALHAAELDPLAVPVAELAGIDPGDAVMVARLFVAPDHRHRGVGRTLLAAATVAAHTRGRTPVLHVSTDLAAAEALYESSGWDRCGTFEYRFRDGTTVVLAAYRGPPPGPT